jgi:hypothetical protein
MSLIRPAVRFLAASLCMLAGLAGCATQSGAVGARGEDAREQVLASGLPVAEVLSQPQLLSVGTGRALLYVDANNRVAFSLDGRVQLLDEGAPVQGGKYLTLRRNGDRLYAFWWSHEKAKSLYFRTSTDGGKTFSPVQMVQSDHGILPTYEVEVDERGRVFAVYTDEREPGYQIYFNRTDDDGLTWRRPDVRLDQSATVTSEVGKTGTQASEPHLARIGNTLVVSWQEAGERERKIFSRLMIRVSNDLGETWTPAQAIFESDKVPSSMRLTTDGNSVYLSGDVASEGVRIWRSDDRGKTWAAFEALPGSQQTVNSQIEPLLHGQYLYLAYTAERAEQKSQIHLGVFNRNTSRWLSAPIRLDKREFDSTKAFNPSIAPLPNGGAIVVWQDYRNIRPNVYASYSDNLGRGWSAPANVQFEDGRYGINSPQVQVNGSGQVVVTFQRFRDDTRQFVDFVAVPLRYDVSTGQLDLGRRESAMSPEAKAERLKVRATTFWKLRLSGDFERTYDFFDPAYRNLTPRDAFAKFQGNLRYHKAEVAGTEVRGNIAYVKLKVNFEVLPTEVLGQKFSRPPADAEMSNEWIWVYDDWYMVHQTALGNRAVDY